MGNRTVAIFDNDRSSEWAADPHLGEMLRSAMNAHSNRQADPEDSRIENYGAVVECTHMDHTTLAVLSGRGFHALAHGTRQPGQSLDAMKLDMLRRAADALGYTLVKK